MAQVWKHGPEDQGELLVLLALADYANDAGLCWPSMSSIAKKARMSERNARRVIRKLENSHMVLSNSSSGRKANTYQILRFWETRTQCPPASEPGHLRQSTRTSATLNPDTAMSAKPSRTVKEPNPPNPPKGGRRFGVPDSVKKKLGLNDAV